MYLTRTHDDAVAPDPRWPWSRLACAVRARWLHGALDDELAAGRSPWTSPALRARAATLASPAYRAQLALSLHGLVRAAELGQSLTAPVRIHRAAVAEEREALLALAARLRDDEPVPVAAVARVAVLLGDGASPAFDARRPVGDLTAALRRCQDAVAAGAGTTRM